MIPKLSVLLWKLTLNVFEVRLCLVAVPSRECLNYLRYSMLNFFISLLHLRVSHPYLLSVEETLRRNQIMWATVMLSPLLRHKY